MRVSVQRVTWLLMNIENTRAQTPSCENLAGEQLALAKLVPRVEDVHVHKRVHITEDIIHEARPQQVQW